MSETRTPKGFSPEALAFFYREGYAFGTENTDLTMPQLTLDYLDQLDRQFAEGG